MKDIRNLQMFTPSVGFSFTTSFTNPQTRPTARSRMFATNAASTTTAASRKRARSPSPTNDPNFFMPPQKKQVVADLDGLVARANANIVQSTTPGPLTPFASVHPSVKRTRCLSGFSRPAANTHLSSRASGSSFSRPHVAGRAYGAMRLREQSRFTSPSFEQDTTDSDLANAASGLRLSAADPVVHSRIQALKSEISSPMSPIPEVEFTFRYPPPSPPMATRRLEDSEQPVSPGRALLKRRPAFHRRSSSLCTVYSPSSCSTTVPSLSSSPSSSLSSEIDQDQGRSQTPDLDVDMTAYDAEIYTPDDVDATGDAFSRIRLS